MSSLVPPSPKRLSITLALAGLLLLFTLTLLLVGLRELLPTERPPANSRLRAVLEGSMAVNTSPSERERVRFWLAAGAMQEGLPAVEALVANNCASCHAPGGEYPRVTSPEDLRHLARLAEPTAATGHLPTRLLHLLAFPLVFLACGALLLRTRWPRRRGLVVACTLAVVFNAAQWWLGQGRPELLWLARTAAGGLALALASLAGAVLWDLRTEPRRR
jgi:hypothetical protein